jgi:hypothetical protein
MQEVPMKHRHLAILAVLFLTLLAAAPAAAEVLHVDLDVQGYLCGL